MSRCCCCWSSSSSSSSREIDAGGARTTRWTWSLPQLAASRARQIWRRVAFCRWAWRKRPNDRNRRRLLVSHCRIRRRFSAMRESTWASWWASRARTRGGKACEATWPWSGAAMWREVRGVRGRSRRRARSWRSREWRPRWWARNDSSAPALWARIESSAPKSRRRRRRAQLSPTNCWASVCASTDRWPCALWKCHILARERQSSTSWARRWRHSAAIARTREERVEQPWRVYLLVEQLHVLYGQHRNVIRICLFSSFFLLLLYVLKQTNTDWSQIDDSFSRLEFNRIHLIDQRERRCRLNQKWIKEQNFRFKTNK